MPTTFPCLDVERYREIYPLGVEQCRKQRRLADRRLHAILKAVDEEGRRLGPFPRGRVSERQLVAIERAEAS